MTGVLSAHPPVEARVDSAPGRLDHPLPTQGGPPRTPGWNTSSSLPPQGAVVPLGACSRAEDDPRDTITEVFRPGRGAGRGRAAG